MKTDPMLSPEELIRQYAPLVYHIVSASLTNPEDIKECVNEVFFAFYENFDSFDPEKGSFASYLAAISKNRAISFYRKNRRHGEMTAPNTDPDTLSAASDSGMEDLLVSKIDLEEALKKLAPEELEIIRQKYYNGMTIKEIADSMNLPYETVKKRHQRSIGKLRLLLLILLAIILLAGCGYIVVRYLGIIPGYGISTTPDTMFYHMPEAVSVDIPQTGLTADITTAVYQDGLLFVRFRIYEQDGTPYICSITQYQNETMKHEVSHDFNAFLNLDSGALEGYNSSDMIDTADNLSYYCVYQPQFKGEELNAVFDGSDTAAVSLTCSFYLIDYGYSKESDEYGIPLESESTEEVYASFTADLTLKSTDVKSLENYTCEYTEENGGAAAIPRLENGELIVEIYPVQGKYGYVFPSITEHTWYYGIAGEPEPGLITATAQDGTVLTGTRTGSGESDAIFFSEWNFGPAEPGTYTLNIPYLLKLYDDDKLSEIPIDITDCTTAKKTYKFDGGSFTITDIEPMTWDDVEAGNYPEKFIPEYHYNEDYISEDDAFLNPFSDADLLWRIDFDTDLEASDETMLSLTMSATRDLSHTMMPDQNFVFPRQLDYADNGRVSYLLVWVGGSVYREPGASDKIYLIAEGTQYDPFLQLGGGYMARWDHEFHLELNVE